MIQPFIQCHSLQLCHKSSKDMKHLIFLCWGKWNFGCVGIVGCLTDLISVITGLLYHIFCCLNSIMQHSFYMQNGEVTFWEWRVCQSMAWVGPLERAPSSVSWFLLLLLAAAKVNICLKKNQRINNTVLSSSSGLLFTLSCLSISIRYCSIRFIFLATWRHKEILK